MPDAQNWKIFALSKPTKRNQVYHVIAHHAIQEQRGVGSQRGTQQLHGSAHTADMRAHTTHQPEVWSPAIHTGMNIQPLSKYTTLCFHFVGCISSNISIT